MKPFIAFFIAFALVSSFLCLIAAASGTKPQKHAVLVIGHRGASGYAPENTMVSFKKALEMGADMIELDVHRTLDGELVIMHDDDTKRITGFEGSIALMTAARIAELDAGAWFGKEFAGERVPTLEQVLEWANGKIKVNIEIKSAGCEEKTVELINKFGMKDSILVTSFNFDYIKKIKELDPGIRTGALVDDLSGPEEIDEIIKTCAPDALNPRYLFVDKSIVRAAHEKGLTVNPYTVNDPISMKRLIDAGVDGIITNYPDVLRKLVKKGKPAETK